MKTSVYEDPLQCQILWEKMWPAKGLFDLWEVRSCFHDVFSRPLHFQTVEKNNTIVGFLPLSWDQESGSYIQFPGETWQGRTWMEQNKIIAENYEIFQMLLDSTPGSVHLRYLDWNTLLENFDVAQQDDEGYLFFPGLCDFSFENYWQGFSGKSRKKLRNELKRFNDGDISFKFNNTKDLDQMFHMNIQSFSHHSYFSDPRFYDSFERLVSFLHKMGMLRITTIKIGGKTAAIDIGAIFKNTYTLLAGGTDPEFPGIAKFINFHHMDWACQKKIDSVDFLCGDFNWKKRFHLTPRPFFEINIDKAMPLHKYNRFEREAICA
ncbi:MAG: GNAT family N-acetyltransferase [Proteobacteria bacterium]|nr:GNAT family N-acetyltransferase [Pseudomonadota bacterium]MBU1390067.1 GNAT family N-acetyltransferase [Pseudomonadota bacterium]MBU1544982.1 GNAT family N-acetyltransferase [Pseudomonadota bacterium]MBU2480668.1 GNAT family N-acetyltransferase [Pseudomonadota bacterium]